MKRRVMGCLLAALVLLIIITGVKVYRELHKKNVVPEESEESAYPGERGVRILKEKDPTDIIWFGKKYQYPNRYPFTFDVPVRYEKEFSEETLKIRSGYNRALIILSDRNGDLDISEEELEKCILRAVNSRQFYFLYMGSERIDEIVSILGRNVNISSDFTLFTKDEIGSLGIVQTKNGEIRFTYNAVIEPSDPEEDGWVWEYIAVAAECGEYDGTAYEK